MLNNISIVVVFFSIVAIIALIVGVLAYTRKLQEKELITKTPNTVEFQTIIAQDITVDRIVSQDIEVDRIVSQDIEVDKIVSQNIKVDRIGIKNVAKNEYKHNNDVYITFENNIDMVDNHITGLTVPKNVTDATTKEYVDNITANKLSLSGGVMDGAINMGLNAVTSSYFAIQPTDLTNKAYIDLKVPTYELGDFGPAGGLVFYVSTNGTNGLEAAPADQSTGIRWFNGANDDVSATGNGIGAGNMNTMLIIAGQGSNHATYAAGKCTDLIVPNDNVDYGDYYLPSLYELNLMYLNLHFLGIGNFANLPYWSSTQYSTTQATGVDFSLGSTVELDKFESHRVRAIRAF